MTDAESPKPIPLLGGYDAAQLWWTVNLVIPTWLLLAVAPRWKHTPAITLISPILYATIYFLTAVSVVNADSLTDMFGLEGVAQLFRDPSFVFLGWVHYIVYDVLVGRWIVLDSIERGCSPRLHVLAIVPTLIFSLMLGPIGWLFYVAVVRPFLLPVEDAPSDKSKTS